MYIKRAVAVVSIIAVVALGAVGGVMFVSAKKMNKESNKATTTLTYTNAKYGFKVTFPATWKGYKTALRILDWGAYGKSESIDFGFSVQKAVFNISVHSKSQWTKIQSDEGPKPTYLAESKQYVFAYATGQDTVNEVMNKRMSEVKDIVKTLKITKQ